MSHQLEIQPRELKFVVEPYKQSECSFRLVNETDQYVAYKIKTTTPKKYCVRPNAGVVKPKATCEVVVIKQATKEVPVDLTCKDKFLVQNTIVPDGTLEENITLETFSKDNERYIEEKKLRVILKESEVVPIFDVKHEPINNVRFERSETFVSIKPSARKVIEVQAIEPRVPMSEGEERLVKEVEEMKVKLHELESKLNKAEVTTLKLTEEIRSIRESQEMLIGILTFLSIFT